MYLPEYGDSPYSGIFYLKINNDIMTLYSKWFDTHSEYEAYKNSQDYILPNVSICFNDLDVHYEKENDPYNGHEYVDLGLPSGTLWAKCNVGAETETDYGLYFQWGDTQGYTADQIGTGNGQKPFNQNDYKFYEAGVGNTKYNQTDGKTVLELEDDAARANMGGEWRMPTFDDFSELQNETTQETITKDGKSGMLFISKSNSNNTIFIPFGGWIINGQIGDIGEWCNLSSNEIGLGGGLSRYAYAEYFYAGDGELGMDEEMRWFGYNIRGVIG